MLYGLFCDKQEVVFYGVNTGVLTILHIVFL